MSTINVGPIRLSTAICLAVFSLLVGRFPSVRADEARLRAFVEQHCYECHSGDSLEGKLDLSTLTLNLDSRESFSKWVLIHDRVQRREMPPPDAGELDSAEREPFTKELGSQLTAVDEARIAREGRAVRRRMNRLEYENTLRDLFSNPCLEIKDFLPKDGEAYGFNKSGEALDVSHVQVSRTLSAAEYAIRAVQAPQAERPESTTARYYTWDQRAFYRTDPDLLVRATHRLLGYDLQPPAPPGRKRRDEAQGAEPVKTPAERAQEAVAVVVSTYEPTEIRFSSFRAPLTGRYKLRFSAYTVWMGRKFDHASPGRRSEPVTVYAERFPSMFRKLGSFDVGVWPTVNELDVWLIAGETIRPDAARFFRSRPPQHLNPLAEADGQPAVAFQWMEVEGPRFDEWPPAGHQLLFGDLPLKSKPARARATDSEPAGRRSASFVGPPGVEVIPHDPRQDADRLLHTFMLRITREPLDEEEVQRFRSIVQAALDAGYSFTDSMVAAYTAILSSPEFLYFDERPGRLSDRALADRLSYFLWNSSPDEELVDLAEAGELHHPEVLRAQTDRLLNDPRASRFIEAFLGYWLDLRRIEDTSPDTQLYPDYDLDDLLVESMLDETRMYFADLLARDVGVAALVDSDFTFLNERLAQHYGIEGVSGVTLRRVALPADSVRGGLLTQASTLKVTSNGTTTSPVVRGVWVMSRLLGQPPPPPPATVPAVEPDTRGATTIREQLNKHRSDETCNACHKNIDPAGFALESFDVLGAWRVNYRSLGDGSIYRGIGHNGNRFRFARGPLVDSTGTLADGRTFEDVRGLKKCLLENQEQLARNLARQLTIYATGAPIGFSDRAKIEEILARTKSNGYGVRSLVHEVVQSDLFLNK